MKHTKRDIIKKIVITVILIIVILLLVLGIQSSDFSKLKKYDFGKSSNGFLQQASSFKSNSMEVSIVSKNEVNLGDFVFNVQGDKKLIANISVIHKAKNNKAFIDNTGDEFIEKGAILRDATINAMLDIKNLEMNINNNKIKDTIKNRLNKNLQNSSVEEIYFNIFIIQ